MIKKILIAVVLSVSVYLLYQYGHDIYRYYMWMMHPPMPVAIGIEAGPVKVSLDEATDWNSVFKALVTLLGSYLGIKLINKFVR